jgi:hypothetical protein
MPTVNTYFRKDELLPQLEGLTPELKLHVAEELTCKEITLDSSEVSVRLIKSIGSGMLADVEMDIAAAPYQERVDRQDEICLNIRRFVLDHIDGLEDAKVWLALSELGHSWEA